MALRSMAAVGSYTGLRSSSPCTTSDAGTASVRLPTRRRSGLNVRAIAEPPTKKGPTLEECEAAVVAGNPPPAPAAPAKPKSPPGTPRVTPLVRSPDVLSSVFPFIFSVFRSCSCVALTGCVFQNLPSRPRRNRRSAALRAAVQETTVSPANFILPLFIHEGELALAIFPSELASCSCLPACFGSSWR